MSYKRRVKNNIPKNSDYCAGCKNRLKIKYKEEEAKEEYLQNKNLSEHYYICNYLKIKSQRCNERKISIMRFECEEDVSLIEEHKEKSYDMYIRGLLHSGYKICGKYEGSLKYINYYWKVSQWEEKWESLLNNKELVSTPEIEYDLNVYSLDEIPF